MCFEKEVFMDTNDVRYNGYSRDMQPEFDTQARGIGRAFKSTVFIFTFLPLLVIGFYIASRFLTAHNSAFTWLGMICVISLMAYGLVLMLKAYMLALKRNHNPLWVLCFLVLIGITCVMTPALAYQPIAAAFARWHWPGSLAWILDIGIGLFIYSKYNFLSE